MVNWMYSTRSIWFHKAAASGAQNFGTAKVPLLNCLEGWLCLGESRRHGLIFPSPKNKRT